MGAYSPAPVMTPEMTARTMDEIIVPTMRAMKAMGSPYKGVLFAGLMITSDGPKLIEYNARFGDPETQVLMLRLMSDLLPALIASRDGQLKSFDLRWYPDAALTVVMAAKGYPGDYKRGSVIEGLDAAGQVEGVEIFHAGTKAAGGKITANGGRVLNVSARGKTVSEAQARAYQSIDRINWPENSAAATSLRRLREQAALTHLVRRGLMIAPISPISSCYPSYWTHTSAGNPPAPAARPPLLPLHGYAETNVRHAVAGACRALLLVSPTCRAGLAAVQDRR